MHDHPWPAASWWRVALLSAALLPSAPARPAIVVFVCEHGAAKSVIAAAYFDKLAVEGQLAFRAVARGVTPQPEPSAATVAGLRSDGIAFRAGRPQALNEEDVRGAVRVVAFCPLPAFAKKAGTVTCDVPAPGENYAASRDAIVRHVKALIEDLARRGE